MRVYISGAITGNDNYIEEFDQAEKMLRERGYEPINPVAITTNLPTLGYEEYMKIDFALLDLCHAIYMIPKWEKSCGANREYGYAMAKDFIILKEQNHGKINAER